MVLTWRSASLDKHLANTVSFHPDRRTAMSRINHCHAPRTNQLFQSHLPLIHIASKGYRVMLPNSLPIVPEWKI